MSHYIQQDLQIWNLIKRLMTIHVYQFSRNSIKFGIFTKVLILNSIIGNKIDQLLTTNLMTSAYKENIFLLYVSQLWAAKTLICINKTIALMFLISVDVLQQACIILCMHDVFWCIFFFFFHLFCFCAVRSLSSPVPSATLCKIGLY